MCQRALLLHVLFTVRITLIDIVTQWCWIDNKTAHLKFRCRWYSYVDTVAVYIYTGNRLCMGKFKTVPRIWYVQVHRKLLHFSLFNNITLHALLEHIHRYILIWDEVLAPPVPPSEFLFVIICGIRIVTYASIHATCIICSSFILLYYPEWREFEPLLYICTCISHTYLMNCYYLY